MVDKEQQLDNLVSAVDQLSTDQKAELVQHLLKASDLNVTFGNNQLSGTIIVQINTMDQSALSDILTAITQRIHTERPTPPTEPPKPSNDVN